MLSQSILRLHICSINVYQMLCWIQLCHRIQMQLCWLQSLPAFLKHSLKIGLMNPYDSLRKYFESNEWNQNSKMQMLFKELPLNQRLWMKLFIHSFRSLLFHRTKSTCKEFKSFTKEWTKQKLQKKSKTKTRNSSISVCKPSNRLSKRRTISLIYCGRMNN